LFLVGVLCQAFSMKRRPVGALVFSIVASLLVAGCVASAPVETEPAEEAATARSSESQEVPADKVAPDWSLTESPADAEVCKIPDGRPVEMQTLRRGALTLGTYGMSNVGFPASPDLISVTGESRYVAVAVSFPDMPGDPENLDGYLREQTELMTQWSEFWSQGSHRYTVDIVEGWREVPSTAESFRVSDQARSERSVGVHTALAREIATAIGPDIDWDTVDGILAVFPLSFDSFPSDWNGRGDSVQTPIGMRQLFYYGGGPFHLTSSNGIPLETKRSLLWSFWIHEILHSQGMNLHSPGNGWPVGLDRNQYPGGGSKFSAAANAWELFKVGWIADSQVHCVEGREPFATNQVMLTPLEIAGGERKIAVARTGPHSGLLVESRRPVGYTQWAPEDTGIMVYRLDTSVMNDRSGEGGADCGNNPAYAKWAYYLPPNGASGLENSCFFEDFLLREGDVVSVDGVTVELVHSSEGLDYVLMSSEAVEENTITG
jgi:hypothetical protein